MTETFTSYALLGSGRLAQHLRFYMQSLKLPFQTWSRRENDEDALDLVLSSASHVLVALKDEVLERYCERIRPDQTGVHFSGALCLSHAYSAHPLMSFGAHLETEDWYRQIPFVLSREEGLPFTQLLPGFPNPHYTLLNEQRRKYHALCSLAGNFSYLLWENIGQIFDRELKLPRQILKPYLQSVVSNATTRDSALKNFTGPVARQDWNVVQAHLRSLAPHPSLLNCYREYLALARNSGHQIPEEIN